MSTVRKREGTDLELHLRKLEDDVARGILDLGEGKVVLGHSLDGRIVISNEVSKHGAGLVEGAVPVVLGHTVLLKEVILQHTGDLERDLLVLAQSALSDKLHDFGKILLLLQNLLGLRTELNETRLCGLVVGIEDFGVLGIREGPVDGREVLPLGELLVQTPEDLHDTECGSGNRI